jgi:hypothetical protein
MTRQKSFLSAEPVQRAVDYLNGILEILWEAPGSEYGLKLLALEREELQEIYRNLLDGFPQNKESVFYIAGKEGARLFVVRQVLAALPPVNACPLHNQDELFRAACSRLADEQEFLANFRLCLDKKILSESVVCRAVELIRRNKMVDRLSLSGHPLHVYCLNYLLPHPAYYLATSHSVLCGASSLNEEQQLHCLLHEFGHVLYTVRGSLRTPANRKLRKQASEQFANRFATGLLARMV